MNKLEKSEYVILSKNNCTNCDIVKELCDDYFIDYTVIKMEDLTDNEFNEIKPKDAKIYPFVFKNKEFIGGFKELRKILLQT